MNSGKDPAHTTPMLAQQGHKAHVVNNLGIVYKQQEKVNKCSGWGIPALGMTLILLSAFLFMLDPVFHVNQLVRKFGPDSLMYNKWLHPPTKVNLNFYVFNYTNSEAFLRGEEELRIQELGPYSFEEVPGFRNLTFNKNNTLTYIPTRDFKEDPEGTVGNLLQDIVVVPNFIFLGLASYLAESSFFTNMAFNVFTKMVKSEPFLTMTVDEYLRGYDEPLLSYARKIVPGMVPISKMSFIDTIVFDGENVVTMNLNDRRVAMAGGGVLEPFSIDQYNGSPGMKHWGYEEADNSTHRGCNTLRGVATEGVLVPRELTEDLRINYYRKAFCRTMQIVFEKRGVTSKGVPGFWLKFTEDNFHNSNPDNSCYCLEETCLPDGLSDISPCLFNMPWAISSPHFLYGDPSLAQAWPALNPNFQDHGTSGILDETFGIIIHAKLRIQLNLVMKTTKYNVHVQPFNEMVLPAMWAEYHFNEIPDFLHVLIYVCVVVFPWLSYIVVGVLAVSGFGLLLKAFVRSLSAKAIYKRLFLYSRPSPPPKGQGLAT